MPWCCSFTATKLSSLCKEQMPGIAQQLKDELGTKLPYSDQLALEQTLNVIAGQGKLQSAFFAIVYMPLCFTAASTSAVYASIRPVMPAVVSRAAGAHTGHSTKSSRRKRPRAWTAEQKVVDRFLTKRFLKKIGKFARRPDSWQDQTRNNPNLSKVSIDT